MYSIILFLILFLASCFSGNNKEIKNQDVNSGSYIEKVSTDNINTGSLVDNSGTGKNNINQEDTVCIQVITYAKNLKTGVCREFSSPCNIPENYKKVESCESSLKEEKIRDVKSTIDKQSTANKVIEKKETLNKNEKEILDNFMKDLDSLSNTIQ